MAHIRYRARVKAILFGQVRDLSSLIGDAACPTSVTGWYLTTWLGGDNEACSVQRLDQHGCADVNLYIKDGDLDMLKMMVSFETNPIVKGTNTRVGPKAATHSAGSIGVEQLRTFLSGGSGSASLSSEATTSRPVNLGIDIHSGAGTDLGEDVAPFGQDVAFGRLGDIFNPQNGSLIFFENLGTDLDAVERVKCRSSCMRAVPKLLPVLGRVNDKIKNTLGSSVVTSSNCGSLFYDSLYTAGPLVPMSYGLFAIPFQEWTSPLVDSKWVAYTGLQAKNNSGLSWAELRNLTDQQLGEHFVDGFLSRPTCCELTMPYCSDLTMDAEGVVSVDTEDISRTLCAVSLTVQGGTQAYVVPSGVSTDKISTTERLCGLPTPQLVGLVKAAVGAQQKGGPRMGAALEANDCENLADCIISNNIGLRRFSERYSTLTAVKQELARVVHSDSRMFDSVAAPDVEGLSEVLHRVGGLVSRRGNATASVSGVYNGPVIQTNVAVVSAKGPSYNANNANQPNQATGLCGHGTVIMRHVLPTGQCNHRALEGTAWLSTVPSALCITAADGLPVKIPFVLKDGSSCSMDIATFGTCLGQSLYRIAGVTPVHRIEAKLPPVSMNAATSPFYHSVFFSGLSYDSDSLGSMAFDASSSSDKPVFGAPVLGLGSSTSLALPITPDLLSDDPKEARQLLQAVRDQANEAWPPRASGTLLRNMMSFYVPVTVAPDVRSLTGGVSAAECICGQFTVAFDNPLHAEATSFLYGRIAEAFNELNKGGDGGVATWNGQYSSATLRVFIPVAGLYRAAAPGGKPVQLSTLRNMQKVASDLGIPPVTVTAEKPPGSMGAQLHTNSAFRRAGRGGVEHLHLHEFA